MENGFDIGAERTVNGWRGEMTGPRHRDQLNWFDVKFLDEGNVPLELKACLLELDPGLAVKPELSISIEAAKRQ